MWPPNQYVWQITFFINSNVIVITKRKLYEVYVGVLLQVNLFEPNSTTIHKYGFGCLLFYRFSFVGLSITWIYIYFPSVSKLLGQYWLKFLKFNKFRFILGKFQAGQIVTKSTLLSLFSLYQTYLADIVFGLRSHYMRSLKQIRPIRKHTIQILYYFSANSK